VSWRRWAATVAAALLLPAGARAQSTESLARGDTASVRVRDVGPGETGRFLRTALAVPHDVIVASDSAAYMARGAVYSRTVVVLGGDAYVASTVHGDVIVVDGDLFLRPGASIDGRAIAIGGGVYNSTLAVVGGGRLSYRDHTYQVVAAGGGTYALDYRGYSATPARSITFPFPAGFRLPGYDRVNGLSLAAGPLVTIDTGRLVVEPTVTYRSHLGVLDPAVRAVARRGRRDAAYLTVGRTTLTNDAWIRGDIVNSAISFATGTDVRNYYRADRAEGSLARRSEIATGEFELSAGALTERAWSVGRDSLDATQHAPFSIIGRTGAEQMLRPNPRVARGTISSAVLGATTRLSIDDLAATGSARAEVPFAAPGDARFVQLTLDAAVSFLTFTTHRFSVAAHGVATVGDVAPAQRFAYLGGGGTLPTYDVLSMGGDQLAFVESRYTIPIERLRVPIAGAPSVTLRHMIGGAGIDGLGTMRQNVGLRGSLSVVGVEYVIDPSGRTDSRLSVFVGFSR
jgi:hypothetical protein